MAQRVPDHWYYVKSSDFGNRRYLMDDDISTEKTWRPAKPNMQHKLHHLVCTAMGFRTNDYDLYFDSTHSMVLCSDPMIILLDAKVTHEKSDQTRFKVCNLFAMPPTFHLSERDLVAAPELL